MLYQVLHGRLASAQGWSSGSPPGGGGGVGGGSGGFSNGGDSDSGSHQGIDGAGQVYTINKDYSDMTDAEKEDANRYAHTWGNVAG